MRGLFVVVALAGCGRLAFDPLAGLGDDTSSDAGGDSGGSGFCASLSPAPLRCADFDSAVDDAGLAAGFTRQQTVVNGGPAGTVRIVDGVSKPNAFESTSPAIAMGDVGAATLEWDLPVPTTRLHYRGEFFLPERPTGTNAIEIMCVELLQPNGDAFYADFIVSPGTGNDQYLEEFSQQTPSSFLAHGTPIPDVRIGAWVPFDWSIDLAARTYSLTLDGTLVAGNAMYPTTPGPVTIQVGINFVSGAAPTHTIYVDNVIVDAE